MSAQDIILSSGTSELTPAAQVRRKLSKVAKLFDATKCSGCKACQVSCSEWNDLRAPVGSFQGSYQNPMDLSSECWTLMKYNEIEQDNKLRWNFTHSACMHCADPACLTACSTKGAIVQRANGVVDFESDKCTGCGYCVSACPFNVPRLDPIDQKAYKCSMCSDRLQVGQEPACVKSCVTGALKYGTREDMLFIADLRIKELHKQGFTKAGLYSPEGVGGTGMMMILHDVSQPENYGLPADPKTSVPVKLWQDVVKPLGTAGILATVAVACLHRITVGRNIVEEDEPAAFDHTHSDKSDKE
ncbi:formate dehydrogenase subunit beta [Shewanella schlegeliana]|uniref:Formate dehydrogenase iron-sulfur subunit n=1 Tax=Shewanella schlegeliana TaxID=190308 RepID=A0ABS1T1Z8_9GAMM|nr:formate dehydrogenase subunit beta [Shewanella schlegeliana]MBL4914823.1 formate dehydrogenase subunit beta [Shewanella schlegeliana]MCL1110486.1 formate dehydrogenase subunit beta [Shewanella schlegeliana]GIU27451.1 formate dehydrogenase subunit beta [Shewanella schlegeliana]